MGATREGRAAGRSILNSCIVALAGLVWLGVASAAPAEAPAPRARDLGVPFDGTPGPNNAITDVLGVEVGFKTLISGDGPLVRWSAERGRFAPVSLPYFRATRLILAPFSRVSTQETATAT